MECYAIAVFTPDDELDAANAIATTRRAIDRAHVAARGRKVADGAARVGLADAERLYDTGDYTKAERKAQVTLQATPPVSR